MTPETLRKFIAFYPELCVECWFCSGKGKVAGVAVGRTFDLVDCYECYGLGETPSIIKMVDYLLKEKNSE